MSGELLRHWRPGSLILIDEPELHLHSHWQTRLYLALRYWQRERGGQMIVANTAFALSSWLDLEPTCFWGWSLIDGRRSSIACGEGLLTGLDVAVEFVREVTRFQTALRSSFAEGLVLLNGKWLLLHFLIDRMGGNPNTCEEWIRHATSVGGLPEAP